MAISRSLRELGGKLEFAADDVSREATKVVRRSAIVLDQTLVSSTPVDTGRARSNWLVGTGSAPENEVPDGQWDRSGQTGIARAQAAIGRYQLEDGALFIANNVPYIEQLENGKSAQAPNGMLRRAIAETVAAIRRLGFKVRFSR